MPTRAVPLSFALILVLLLFLIVVPTGRADDVPDAVRTFYDTALQFRDAGDLKKAYSAISKGKAKLPASADFWQLYVEIYRKMGKKESILWDRIIARAEAKHPTSPVFFILRARLATDSDARIANLERAVALAPDIVEPQALLAREHVRREDVEAAQPLVDAILALQPGHEMALALRGDLKLLAGNVSGALTYAEAQLARHDAPALHDLLARTLLALPGSPADQIERAEKEARKAFGARGSEWRFALTLAEALDRRGQSKEARALLEKTARKTPAPEIGAKLGEFAFREGDYGRALRGISKHPHPRIAALRALATCEARLGDAPAVERTIKRLLERSDDHDMRCWIAERLIEVGNADAALQHLQGVQGEAADFLRLRATAWKGDAAEAKQIAGTRARAETRAAEEWVLPILNALLLEKLGARAEGARKLLQDASAAAARAGIKAATVPAEEPVLVAHTLGYLQRYATYRRSLCGAFFEPLDELSLHQRTVDDVIVPTATVEARATCIRDPVRFFPFRPGDELLDEDLQATMTAWLGAPSNLRWNNALGGFEHGCAMLLAGNLSEAIHAFDRAVEEEGGWGRARLFRSVARALEGSDPAGAAQDAALAAKALPEDWEGRRAGILVRLLAGRTPSAEVKALAERWESFAPRRYGDL